MDSSPKNENFWIWVAKQLMVPIDFHSMEKNTMEVKGDRQFLFI